MDNVDKIKDALDAVLTAITEHDAARSAAAKGKTPNFRVQTFSEIVSTSMEDHELIHMLDDPVGSALRKQVTSLGKHLYRLTGSTNAMLKVSEEVSSRDARHSTRRSYIIDQWWDGIGSGNDVWHA